ncbi:non-specific lipid-transfer-like protein [Cinnamomum micranthum f. kanehirae]|uniref:Non-specific lipid-transfer protein n=1 Tax=Cinnamomum micranthum f. kanehirae TaxID=337451 RepID=A0A3S3MNA7_9MAGN|nr:non-specific lipid-transfer-like protein [Cinnamomum micranthum f. kanehirae]
MANNSLWMVMMVVMLVVTATEAVSCGDAVSALIPCGSFLIGSGPPKPSAECCQSAQTLNKMAATLATRRALCQCLKQTGPSFGVKPERAKQLPPLCKLKLNIPVSPNVDCNK